MADHAAHGSLPGSGDAPIRQVTDEEVPAFFTAMARQFGDDISDESIEKIRGACELDRTFAWFEGERIMGTAETVSFTVGMPGAAPAPCAGLTAVGVNPLRRRRGILTALLRRQMDQAHERGEPFGALYASESAIYGRYGYGAAAPAVEYRVATAHGSLRSPAAASASADLEMVDTDEALQRLPGIYDAVHAATPGCMSRSPGRWRAFVGFDPGEHRDGFSPYYHVVLADRGYVVYRLKDDWDEGTPDGTLRVVELLARDADAYAALWQLCLSMDLVSEVRSSQRPPDDAVLLALTDPARAKIRAAEPLYLRLLDLASAFAARRYAGEGGAVVEVRDAFCPWNAGRWALDLGPDGGSARRTDVEPDLVLDVAELGGAFLGGVRLAALARAGRIEETRSGAAWDLDRLLAADPLPWNPRIF
jgi:predicted acetyltransferase